MHCLALDQITGSTPEAGSRTKYRVPYSKSVLGMFLEENWGMATKVVWVRMNAELPECSDYSLVPFA